MVLANVLIVMVLSNVVNAMVKVFFIHQDELGNIKHVRLVEVQEHVKNVKFPLENILVVEVQQELEMDSNKYDYEF